MPARLPEVHAQLVDLLLIVGVAVGRGDPAHIHVGATAGKDAESTFDIGVVHSVLVDGRGSFVGVDIIRELLAAATEVDVDGVDDDLMDGVVLQMGPES